MAALVMPRSVKAGMGKPSAAPLSSWIAST